MISILTLGEGLYNNHHRFGLNASFLGDLGLRAAFRLERFGMGAGIHRLLVHRSFRCGPVTRAFFCAIATMAMQGAYISHAWYEIDITGLIIRGLGKLGLVHDVFVHPDRRVSTVPTGEISRSRILNTANSWTSRSGPSAGIEQSPSDLFPE